MRVPISRANLKIAAGLVIPWALRQLGAGKYLRERLLHVPDAVLLDAAAESMRRANVPAGTFTDAQATALWRAVESVQADLAEGYVAEKAGSL